MTSLNEVISSCTGEEDKIQCATFNYGQDSILIDESCGFKSDGDIGNISVKESIITDNSYGLKENTKTEENCEEIVPGNDMDRAVYNDLVNYSSENLNITHRKGLPFSFSPNNEVHDLDSKISGLNLGLNKTFDANWGTADEVLAIQKDKTLNLSTCKPEHLKFEHLEKLNRLDSEESLGIIPDLLDDNTSLEIFVPFQSHKSSIKLVNKFQDTNCFSFSPLHVTKKMKVSLADAKSPLKRDGRVRFTSTPKQLSAKLTSLLKSSENDQDCGTEGGKEVDVNELKECYEDFKKGNLFTSTSKGSPLQDSLNILETTNTLKVNSTIERKDVSSILLNATFHIQPEFMPEVLPLKVLADTLPIPSENVSRNKTITIENINDATKVFEKEGKSSSIDLPGSIEVNKLNLTEIISSPFSETSAKDSSDHDIYLVKSNMQTTCKTKSKLRKSLSLPMQELDPPIDHDSYLVESTKQISCKTKIKLRKSLSMAQKLDPPKSKFNQCSELNSTICLENKKPSNIATNLKKRYSLSAVPTNKTRSSTSGLFKTYPMLKSDKCVDSEVTEKKQPSLKTANSAKSFKNRVSLIKQKSSTHNPSIGSIIKPKVFLPIKNELKDEVFVEVDEKTSLDSTFVKDEEANIKKVLSPINEVHKLTESQMETLSQSPSERNGTFTLSLESCVDKVNELSKSNETNLAIQTEDGNRTIAAPKKCFEIPMINTKVLKKDEASKKTILVKPKEFAKDKLGTEKNIKNNKIKFLNNIKEKELNTSPRISKYSKQLPLKTQNVNLNEKRNFLKAANREQYSSLPILRSTFSKNAIPEKSRINSKLHIESKDSKASFSSHSNSNNVKLQKKASEQTARVLRPPEVSLPKENGKMKNSSVPDEAVALFDEIDKTEKFDVSQGVLKPKVENALPAPKQVGGVKTGSKIPASNASRLPSLRKILPPRTYSR